MRWCAVLFHFLSSLRVREYIKKTHLQQKGGASSSSKTVREVVLSNTPTHINVKTQMYTLQDPYINLPTLKNKTKIATKKLLCPTSVTREESQLTSV